MAKASDFRIKKPKYIQQDLSLFDNLDIELLTEILQRLPLKLIFACKCVSKSWFSLLSGSRFVRCYLRYHRIKNTFALYHQLNPTVYNIDRRNLMGIQIASKAPVFDTPGFPLDFLPSLKSPDQPAIFQYLASSSGLVLCSTSLSIPLIYVVCNPLTKQWIALPPPPTNSSDVRIGFVCNSHDSCLDDRDEVVLETKTTSFKVVRVDVANCDSSRRQSDTLKLEIFCSETWRWTEKTFKSSYDSKHEMFYRWNCDCPDAVVCGGVLYWDKLSDSGIFTYDPYQDVFKTVKIPDEITTNGWLTGQLLGFSSGHLRFAYFSTVDKIYDIWELVGGRWSLLCRFGLDEMKNEVNDRIDKFRMSLVAMHPFDGDVLYFWCEYPSSVVEYNITDRVLKSPDFIQGFKPMSNVFRPTFFPFVLPCWPNSNALFQSVNARATLAHKDSLISLT